MFKDLRNTPSNVLIQDTFKKTVDIDQNDAAIKNSIKNIILTRKGTLPGKPYFGSNIYNIAFESMTPLTLIMARNFVNESLSLFENRISINDVDVKFIEEFNRITIDVNYSYVNDIGAITSSSTSVALNV